MCVAIERTSEYWDDQALTFDDEPDHGLRNSVVREAWRRLLRSALPEPPAEIADLGCGTGSLSVLLASDGYRVTGVDLSAKMIAAATSKAAASDVLVSFLHGDASDPDLDSGVGTRSLCAMSRGPFRLPAMRFDGGRPSCARKMVDSCSSRDAGRRAKESQLATSKTSFVRFFRSARVTGALSLTIEAPK